MSKDQYTQDQADSLYLAQRRLHHIGRPETAAVIATMMASGREYGEIWAIAQADVEEMVRPEKPADSVPPPPLTGQGSTTKAWQKFALQVSDMEEEVVLSMGRNDIIKVLVDRDIIDEPGDLLGDKSKK